MGKIITIFGSSRPVESESEYQFARELGKHLALAGFTICNGGYGGTMEASARGATEAEGSTIGVTTDFFSRAANRWIGQEIRAPSLIERLLKLIELGDAYVVLKGGTGTLLELAAVWEFINKGVSLEKPIMVLAEYWGGLIETLRTELISEGLGDFARFVEQFSGPEECARKLQFKLG